MLVVKILRHNSLSGIAHSLGFHNWSDVHEASAWLEIKEGIWLYPNLDDTWTAKFRSEHQLMLFKLKYGEYL